MTMNAEKLTQKSAEAVRLAQSLATEHGNPQIEQVHLLAALLADDAGLIPQLLTAMGVTLPSFAAGVKDIMERQPRVTSSGHEPGKIYISADTEKALNRAEAAAGEMKDEFVSVEHLFLALLDTAGRELSTLFRTYRVTREGALQALTAVRGNQATAYTAAFFRVRPSGSPKCPSSAKAYIPIARRRTAMAAIPTRIQGT